MKVVRRRVDIFHQAGLGDLQFEGLGGQLMGLQQLADHGRQLRMTQLHGGQVHRHTQPGMALGVPLAQLAAGLVEHPLADFDDAAVLLGQRYEQVRRYQLALRMLPANQRLDPGDAVLPVVDLRLVDQVELVALEGFAEILLQLPPRAHLAVDAGDVELIAVA